MEQDKTKHCNFLLCSTYLCFMLFLIINIQHSDPSLGNKHAMGGLRVKKVSTKLKWQIKFTLRGAPVENILREGQNIKYHQF